PKQRHRQNGSCFQRQRQRRPGGQLRQRLRLRGASCFYIAGHASCGGRGGGDHGALGHVSVRHSQGKQL
ncbi:hypothetical protein H4S06_006873, partial [Coemansia sp. BCRC 34490]